MDDDNIFDEDDALDYILYEDAEKGENNSGKSGGCLSIFIFFLITPTALGYLLKTIGEMAL